MNIVEVYRLFPTQDACLEHLEKVRWHGKPICPYCKSNRVSALPKEKRHHCNNCNTSFSVTVGTIFHKTKVDFQKWFVAISLVLNAKKGISSRQLSRDIQVNKDTAWYMAMRIRKATAEYGELLQGIVEVDETYIGGKPRKGSGGSSNPSSGQNKRGRGTKKVPVVGLVERGGKVHARVSKKVDGISLSRIIKEHVDIESATVFTDEWNGYRRIGEFVPHFTVDHRIQYANGEVHTNTAEGFWALLKRGIVGQYHKVSIRYLPKYIDEFCYRYNNRNNIVIFEQTLSKALGV